MALSQAAEFVEKIIGHKGNANTEQDLSNPIKDAEKYADPSGEKMKALVWIFYGVDDSVGPKISKS
jgi:hypothetical protein